MDKETKVMLLEMVRAVDRLTHQVKRIADDIEILKSADEERWTPTNYKDQI